MFKTRKGELNIEYKCINMYRHILSLYFINYRGKNKGKKMTLGQKSLYVDSEQQREKFNKKFKCVNILFNNSGSWQGKPQPRYPVMCGGNPWPWNPLDPPKSLSVTGVMS